VVNDLEVVPTGLGVLQTLDLVVLEFEDFSAADAHEVVVVLHADGALVVLLPAPEILLLQDPRLRQKIERAVHRGFRDRVVLALGEAEQLVGREMALGFHRTAQDRAPLSGELEAFFL